MYKRQSVGMYIRSGEYMNSLSIYIYIYIVIYIYICMYVIHICIHITIYCTMEPITWRRSGAELHALDSFSYMLNGQQWGRLKAT